MSKHNLVAKCINVDVGYDIEKQCAKQYLSVGNTYEVEDIYMGQSTSSVTLTGIENGTFSTMTFDFYDDAGNIVNIFNSSKWNPYLHGDDYYLFN